jgi:RNA recognition motif-containing protein
MILQKQQGDYNSETSIYVGLINPFCTESDIIEELNLVLRDDRIKKEKEEASLSRNKMGQGKEVKEGKEEDKKEKEVEIAVVKSDFTKNFILSSMVFHDPVTQRPKQFAFVDFNTKEAAQICVKAWNTRCMKKFPNRLMVTIYEEKH